VLEPGLDRHEWESEWASLEPGVLDSPREALPELDDLVRRMLDERGFSLDDPVAGEGDDPEVLTEYASARDIRLRAERDDPDLSPGDVASAVESYRNVYEYLLENRSAP
jgi:hypothetical protein